MTAAQAPRQREVLAIASVSLDEGVAVQGVIADVERAIDVMDADPKAAQRLREALRGHLLVMMDLPATTSLIDALGSLKDEQRPEPGTAALIVRCLAVQGALPNPANSNQIARAIPSFERDLIESTLREHDGDVRRTTVALGLPRKTFYDKLTRHGLTRRAFEPGRGA